MERIAEMIPTRKKGASRMTLAELRKYRGITQEGLAKKIRTQQSHIAKIERATELKLSTITRYLKGLNYTLYMDAGDSGGRFSLEIPRKRRMARTQQQKNYRRQQ
jgi:transcriptional regulator with XRE-family HTH domain